MHLLPRKLALIGDVVDRINRADGSEALIRLLPVLQIKNRGGRFPVVAVQDVRNRADLPQQGNHCLGEKSETPAVIVIAVQLFPLAHKQLILADEPDRHAGALSPVDIGVNLLTFQPDRPGADKGQIMPEVFPGVTVQGRHDLHIVPRRFQNRRQTAGDVSQSSRLAEGGAFARNVPDSHVRYLLIRFRFFAVFDRCYSIMLHIF